MDIGFIGLGSMGRPMSLNLVKAGHRLKVHDIDRDGLGARELLESGATWANSPKESAQGSEIIFTSLPGPVEIEAVALGDDGIFEGASKGSVYIDLSSNSPTLMRKIYKVFKEKGVDVLDSPVSENSDTAKFDGTLTIMVGGDKAVFDRVTPILDAIGHDHLMYIGESGAGAISKIVNNYMVYVIHAGMAETITLGVKAGVPMETLAQVIASSSGRSLVGDDLLNTVSKSQVSEAPGGFPLWIGRKDIRLATELARQLDVPMEIGNLVEQRYTEWMARGWRDHPINVVSLVEEAMQRLTHTEKGG
jgi:3-hydroxyisobutyrate dehydrogenase